MSNEKHYPLHPNQSNPPIMTCEIPLEEYESLKRENAELKKGAKNLILDNYLQDKEIRHHKYKRCLAMAEACMHKRWRPDEGFDYARSTRHMKKWLDIAEKFKEAK